MLIHKIKNSILKILLIPKLLMIKKKYSFLKGKTIFLFGSSPKPNISYFQKDFLIICCNASAKNVANFSLPEPVITIIDNELIDKEILKNKKSRSSVIDNKILKNINLGHLISVQSNHSSNTDTNLLKAKIKSFNFFSKKIRKTILDKVSNLNLLDNNLDTIISTGIFAAYFCFFCKAKRVYLSGFSLHIDEDNQKWFYDVDGEKATTKNVRNHSLADSLAVSLLVINGYNIISCEKDFLPVTKNWE